MDFSRAIDKVIRVRGNTTMFFNATRGYGIYCSWLSLLVSWRSCSFTFPGLYRDALYYAHKFSIPYRQTKRKLSIKTDESALCRLIFRICCSALTASYQQWFIVRGNYIRVDNDLFHVGARWDFVHHIQQDIFNDAA